MYQTNFGTHGTLSSKTLHMSTSVSGFYPGKPIRKYLFRFLQSNDRKHLLSKVNNKCYHVYTLDSYGHDKYIYSRQNILITVRFSLVGFKGVQVQIYDDVIVTDGYPDVTNSLSIFQNKTNRSFFSIRPSTIQALLNERK